mmetsp:Transcript_117949/g.367472  ORF Transcript_117949/g.367472 Transcript_117949/m.367472 type:complete len:215 (+) Transcript_117949:28-672(+)
MSAGIDGRWPWPARLTGPCAQQGRLRRPPHEKSSCRSQPASPASRRPFEKDGRSRSSEGGASAFPFFDVERAGGLKMSLVNRVEHQLDARYSLMRPHSAARFQDLEHSGDDAGPGPGAYPVKQWPQREALDGSFVADGSFAADLSPASLKPSLGSAVFRSGEPRVPTNCTSWLLLRARDSELGGAAVEDDARRRLRHSNGRLKGACFGRSARLT